MPAKNVIRTKHRFLPSTDDCQTARIAARAVQRRSENRIRQEPRRARAAEVPRGQGRRVLAEARGSGDEQRRALRTQGPSRRLGGAPLPQPQRRAHPGRRSKRPVRRRREQRGRR